MKRMFLFVFIFLAACTGQVPQVTVTRSAEVTVTLPPTETPIPTPTSHPQFIAQEGIDIGGNLSVILGEKVEGGTLIDSFVASSELTPEQQTELLGKVDYTAELGIPADDAVWMQNEKGETVLAWESDHSRIIGWWMRSKVTARTGMVWNAPELVDPETGESVFFNPGVARIWPTQNGHTNEWNKMSVWMNQVWNDEAKDWRLDRGASRTFEEYVSIVSIDGSETVFGLYVTITDDTSMTQAPTDGNGVFFFEDGEENGVGNGQIKKITLTNFKVVGPR